MARAPRVPPPPEILPAKTDTQDLVDTLTDSMNEKIVKESEKRERKLLHIKLKVDEDEGIALLQWLKDRREKAKAPRKKTNGLLKPSWDTFRYPRLQTRPSPL